MIIMYNCSTYHTLRILHESTNTRKNTVRYHLFPLKVVQNHFFSAAIWGALRRIRVTQRIVEVAASSKENSKKKKRDKSEDEAEAMSQLLMI